MSTQLRTLAVAVALAATGRAALAQGAASSEFWSALGDTTLVRLVHETRLANRDIQIASARAHAARATRTSAARSRRVGRVPRPEPLGRGVRAVVGGGRERSTPTVARRAIGSRG